MAFIEGLKNLRPGLAGILIFMVAFILALGVRHFLLLQIRKWAACYQFSFEFFQVLTTPFLLCSVLAGLIMASQIALLPSGTLSVLNKALKIVFILTLIFAIIRCVRLSYRLYIKGNDSRFIFVRNMFAFIEIAIVTGAFLVIVAFLGIPTGAFLIGLSLLMLLFMLVFKESLKNLLASHLIQNEKSINPGDFIEMKNGLSGYVVETNWRTTRLKELGNRMLIIPNCELIENPIINYSLGGKPFKVPIRVSTNYDSSPEFIERILLETSMEGVNQIPGLSADPPPTVLFEPGFGESSLDFTLFIFVEEVTDKSFVAHELRKRIFQTFRGKGIKLAHPVRTIFVAQNH